MNWKKISFERQKLFDEVWTTPVKTLAKGYGLSDVGLRKICVALDVPLPPRGYWAKLAAGKTIPKPLLHETTAPATYERVINVVKIDDVLEERVTKARDSTTNVAAPNKLDYAPPPNPDGFSAQAKLVIRALKSTKLDEGAFSLLGVTWADISVSPGLKERALLLVDRFAHELNILGAKFENTHPPLPPVRRGMRRDTSQKRNCFILHGQRFFIQIRERIIQELVPPPAPKPQKALRAGTHQSTWTYRPPEYCYVPTGKFSVSIVDVATYYDSHKVEDTARGTIEDKVEKAARWVADFAIRRNVENELRVERELARRTKAKEWQIAKENKDLLLAKLSEFEKMAKDLDRARSLRRLIAEIEAHQDSVPLELATSLGLIAKMADWLDPLVKAPWPEIDSVGDKSPFGSPW